jgi:hypothetical protein
VIFVPTLEALYSIIGDDTIKAFYNSLFFALWSSIENKGLS